jgi:hypothetical protein
MTHNSATPIGQNVHVERPQLLEVETTSNCGPFTDATAYIHIGCCSRNMQIYVSFKTRANGPARAWLYMVLRTYVYSPLSNRPPIFFSCPLPFYTQCQIKLVTLISELPRLLLEATIKAIKPISLWSKLAREFELSFHYY